MYRSKTCDLEHTDSKTDCGLNTSKTDNCLDDPKTDDCLNDPKSDYGLDCPKNDDGSDQNKSYETNFDPSLYWKAYYKSFDEEVHFFVNSYMDAIAKGDWRLNKVGPATVVDIGCGPVPAYIGALLSSFDKNVQFDVTMADFAPKNREAIQLWTEGSASAIDWSSYFEYIAAKSGSMWTSSELMSKVRKSIKTVSHCDVNSDTVIGKTTKKFDIITSTLCIEFSVSDSQTYMTALQRLSGLLEEGGLLLMAGALENSTYELDGHHFKSFSLTQETILSSLLQSRLKSLHLSVLPRVVKKNVKPADHKGVYFVAAVKI